MPVTKPKVILLLLLLLPSVASAQRTRAFSQEQELIERILRFMPREGPELVELFDDSGVLHGDFLVNGRSTASSIDLLETATHIANAVRSHFTIPAEYASIATQYTWVVQHDAIAETKLAKEIGGHWRRVAFVLSIDGVPLEDSELSVLFDTEGRARLIQGTIPRLRPEIVAAVHGSVIPPLHVEATIQKDGDAQTAKNPFGIVPGEPLHPVDLQLLAVAKPPYALYRCTVQAALYTLNALTGEILDRQVANTEAARRVLASIQIKTLSRTINTYVIDNGSYPTAEQGLSALVSAPTSEPQPRRYPRGGYVSDKELLDPWGGMLVYKRPGKINSSEFDLCSLGRDRKVGGDGPDADVCNYSSERESRPPRP